MVIKLQTHFWSKLGGLIVNSVNLVELASLRIRVGESKEFVRLCRSSSSWLPVFVVAHLALPMFVIVFGGRVESCDGRDPVVRCVIKCTIHTSLKLVHQFGGVTLMSFIPMTGNICMACAKTLASRRFEGSVYAYIGWLHVTLHDFKLKTWTLQVKTLSLHHKVLVLNALTYLILKIVQNVNITIALDIQLIGVENCMEKPFVHTILLRHLQLNVHSDI
ncbi:hypothetical protein PHAVU_007G149200 [Phaseolus vulgaris]|uniref:Uncharacterized protein n=1 Tax=Phaseolus vulgaris TaxID=3885 RepID=V7BES4_PHAVU|nr:hypothetical protein PHAVU_007G149200g [Phaseolus vulgaris]ESW16349.1 hypothetical protein PHAVU_007G149200g [Phaseolus vulgaris]